MTTVRAAGGVVWRPDPAGAHAPLVALVHRPRYDDWSLPKGKLRRAEHPLAGAVREVGEETSVTAVPEAELPSVRYQVRLAGPHPEIADKIVRYWSMRAVTWVDHPPDREVDRVRWATREETARLLTYPHDQLVASAFFDRPAVTGGVAFVRSAKRVKSAEALGRTLALLAPTRIVTGTTGRCVATLTPLATATAIQSEPDRLFDEDADPARTATALVAL
ncbi:MAG: NUDIX hydrolase, partial [Dactylosporangium sp.]|nr:NUDIX hydrolase [Dactylosporangium sp.]NNJ60388.1 NUDIX hydrolase [Dactylosporangium sp.]